MAIRDGFRTGTSRCSSKEISARSSESGSPTIDFWHVARVGCRDLSSVDGIVQRREALGAIPESPPGTVLAGGQPALALTMAWAPPFTGNSLCSSPGCCCDGRRQELRPCFILPLKPRRFQGCSEPRLPIAVRVLWLPMQPRGCDTCRSPFATPGLRTAPPATKPFADRQDISHRPDISRVVWARIKGVLPHSVFSNRNLDSGKLRMRWPVSAATALTTAGGTPGTPGSPIPPTGAPLSMMRMCTFGISLRDRKR